MISTSYASAIITAHVCMLCFLRAKLRRLGLVDQLQSAVNSIYVQFSVFVGVYVCIVAFNILQLALNERLEYGSRVGLSVLNMMIKEFSFQIPIIYILYVHSTTLQKDIKEKDNGV